MNLRITPTQLEILCLVRDGYTNNQIGLALGMKENTVKSHIRRAAERLDAVDRTSAVIKAIRQGFMNL